MKTGSETIALAILAGFALLTAFPTKNPDGGKN
jgi:hypothetical protein